MNLIELILAIVLIIVIVRPPTTLKKIVITNSGRLIFAFVVIYLALNHGKKVGLLSSLIFVVMLNNDILEGIAPNKNKKHHDKLRKKTLRNSGEKLHHDQELQHGGNNHENSILNHYVNRSWSKDYESRYGHLENGDWDNTECRRYVNKCSRESLRVIRENAPMISRKYSYRKARDVLDKLIKESLHDCLRYAKTKCTNKRKLKEIYNELYDNNSIDRKFSREEYRRFRKKNFARHAREDLNNLPDSCEINDFGEYYSTDDQYDSGSESDSDSSSESDSSSDSDYDSDYDERNRIKKIRNLNVRNMEIQNMLLPLNSNIPLPTDNSVKKVQKAKHDDNAVIHSHSHSHKNKKDKNKNCYEWNNKQWIGEKPENPLLTECGLKDCVECKNDN